MLWTDLDPTVLITSDDLLPDQEFHGYCFHEADLIIGQSGARQHGETRHRPIPPGLDGSYVTISRLSPEAWQIGTDYKGFSHLYYFASSTYWAISNSYMYLHNHLRDHGIGLEPNPAVIAAYAANINLVRTLMSFDTPTRGISLLPSDAALRVTTGAAPSLEETIVESTEPIATDYETALRRYLDIWSARFQTIFSAPDLNYRFHVTGGRDSRGVLAIGARALDVLDPSLRSQVHFFSQPAKHDDFRVASLLAERLDFPLNVPLAPHRQARSRSPYEAFQIWENAFCGTYSHLMFPQRAIQQSHLIVAGVGGEAHRRSYRPELAEADIEQITETVRSGFGSTELFLGWQASLVAADDRLRRRTTSHPLAMVRSHREFRDRYHSGKDTIWTIAALPLCSQYLVPCSNLLPETDFQQSQILFDIMSVANPEIVRIPYEQPKKEPTDHNLRRLAQFEWSPHPSSGEVFAGDVVETGPVPTSDLPTPLGYLLERVERDLDLAAASDIVERSVLEDGIAVLRGNVSAGRQNLHEHGRTAHLAYLLAALLD